MKYKIIEVEGINGLEKHVIIENENGGYTTFPASDDNPSYIEFKKQIGKEK